MTDITELAQRMKAAAEKATPGEWWADEVKNEGCYGSGDDCVEGFTSYAIYGSDGQTLFDSLNSDAACICEEYDGEGHVAWDETAQRNAEFIALANPANVLALVEALEKAQTINAAAEKLVRCKGRYHSEQNYRALAALFGVNTPDLPPLDDESRAVTVENLQESAYRAGLTAGWNLGLANNNDGFNKCLAAHTAGIKWEAE
ncbi:TPA: ead/Ea22-like family protein [Klebsiella pneumoniae subsp. pneumoniae]|nr:ead/Ea22-like family protein [Klebsiella pneumoniae subsp. pneumoniae]HDZ3115118.1 ead/Ea22-like family protein [Klebsiella pneumoniae]